MMKEMDETNYFPGYITMISGVELDNLLSRSSKEDNQRRTPYCHIYAKDNLLGGK